MIAAEAFCPVVPNYVAGVDTCPGYSAYFIQNVRFDRSGIYRFTENSPNTVGILFLNDQQVLSSRMEQTDHLVDVRLAAGTYELMYGALHLPAAGPYPAANPQAPSISRPLVSRTVTATPCSCKIRTNAASASGREAVHFDPGVGFKGIKLTCTN